MSATKPSKAAALKQKVNDQLAKFRKTPIVTPEQKLHVKIDSMKKEAQELNSEAAQLQSKAATFSARAGTTPSPLAPPPEREPLFERHPTGAPSNYDAQVRAYNVLTTDWKAFDKEVKAFDKKLDTFAKTLANMKEKHFETEKAVGKTEHEFIGLDNALHNLKLQKVELSKAVAAVPLPSQI
ncbi:hypothetical protein Slin15195_G059240 [Septoria linicola]|uniref:Uncharacterized protein n=1 Tax=Septoria linicola TaxID=215465 RepID=A0A9Q9EJ24_9PEZI|nr:hypothetical protein Slin14017_G075100 [Septoria linicola]USW52605.1 hypothetical protein Slin15195_G059240 [Septoria linicola]